MSVADDVQNLFDRFDGDAMRYRNIRRDAEARSAAMRWPMFERLAGLQQIARSAAMPVDASPAHPFEVTADSGRRHEALNGHQERLEFDLSLLRMGLGAAALVVEADAREMTLNP